MVDRRRVTIVVSDAFTDHAVRLAATAPVWLVRTPKTEAIGWPEGADLTKFNASADPEASLLAMIDTVDLHHPSFKAIEVVGTPMSDPALSRFRGVGFDRFEVTPDGFVAFRATS